MHTPNQQPIGANDPNTLLKYPCLIFKLNRGLDIVIINTDGLQDTQLLIVLGGNNAYVNEVAKTLNLTNEDKVTDNGVITHVVRLTTKALAITGPIKRQAIIELEPAEGFDKGTQPSN